MTVTSGQQTVLEKRNAPIVYFVELDFASATVYFSSFNKTFTWGGHDWIGLGSLGSISEMKSEDSTDPHAVNLGLNVANATLLQIACGPVEEYRGRDAKIYMCPLSEAHELVDTPIKCWEGSMDTMVVSAGKSESEDGVVESSISLRCEPFAKNLRRKSVLRVNNAQHQANYPTETGFIYQQDLIAHDQVWMSSAARRAFGS